jgi:hypothetical protein
MPRVEWSEIVRSPPKKFLHPGAAGAPWSVGGGGGGGGGRRIPCSRSPFVASLAASFWSRTCSSSLARWASRRSASCCTACHWSRRFTFSLALAQASEGGRCGVESALNQVGGRRDRGGGDKGTPPGCRRSSSERAFAFAAAGVGILGLGSGGSVRAEGGASGGVKKHRWGCCPVATGEKNWMSGRTGAAVAACGGAGKICLARSAFRSSAAALPAALADRVVATTLAGRVVGPACGCPCGARGGRAPPPWRM